MNWYNYLLKWFAKSILFSFKLQLADIFINALGISFFHSSFQVNINSIWEEDERMKNNQLAKRCVKRRGAKPKVKWYSVIRKPCRTWMKQCTSSCKTLQCIFSNKQWRQRWRSNSKIIWNSSMAGKFVR